MTFDDREKAFEDKYKHDQELRFKATARRNKLLGLWTAQQLGLAGTEADRYAQTIVDTELSKGGGEAAVIAKIKSDLAAKGLAASDHGIRRELERLGQLARQQVMKE